MMRKYCSHVNNRAVSSISVRHTLYLGIRNLRLKQLVGEVFVFGQETHISGIQHIIAYNKSSDNGGDG